MKRTATIILTTAVVLAALLWVAGLAGAGPLAKPNLQGGAPTVVRYQGQVPAYKSVPYDGEGYFKFAIVSRRGIAAPTTYWSNDGSSVGGAEPREGVVLPVTGGLFNVLLGDTSLPGMTQPLEASVFSDTERYLRVWFSPGGGAYEQLEPDQRMAAVPYALQAQEAVNADTVDGRHASDLDFAEHIHTHDGLLPAGAMVLGATNHETTLIEAGFSHTGPTLGDTWSTKVAMRRGRRYMAAAVVEGVIYVIGGQSSITDYDYYNEAYDPVTNSWRSRARMPTGRQRLAAVAAGGKVYAIGGRSTDTTYETANEAYDPVINSWSTKAAMPTGRYSLAAVAVDGVVYAIGGVKSGGLVSEDNEAYDPVTNSWRTKAAMSTGRYELAAAAADGVIYAIGGRRPGDTWETANEAYDPATNLWAIKAAMPTGRQLLAAAAVHGVVYAIGGRSTDTTYETANEAYDPVTNSWRPMAAMPTGRSDLAAAAVHGVVYTIGGWSRATTYETANEAYTPALYVYRKD
jgi:hypothetical protein